MAKLMTLTDRLKLEIPVTGDLIEAQYARFALDGVIDVANDEVFEVHSIIMQPRYPSTTQGPFNHTGAFVPLWANVDGVSGAPGPNFDDTNRYSNLRLLTTTIAYRNIRELGISTPGIISMEDHWTYSHASSLRDQETPPSLSAAAYGVDLEWGKYEYSTLNVQPMVVASDILLGVSADNWSDGGSPGDPVVLDLEVDVVVMGKARKGTKADLAELREQNNIA